MQKYGEYMNLQSIFMKINIFKITEDINAPYSKTYQTVILPR